MHRYTKFHIEAQALKNWIMEVDRLRDVTDPHAFEKYVKEYIPSEFWNDYQRKQEEYFNSKPITKNEKVLYLYFETGLAMNKIQRKLGIAPNTIMQLVRERPQYRYMKDDDPLDMLIKDWKPYRDTLPKEFFIKYLT